MFIVSDAITVINSSIEADDTAVLVENLHNYYSGLENVQDHEALQYLNVMKALRVAKAEVSQARNGYGYCVPNQKCSWELEIC